MTSQLFATIGAPVVAGFFMFAVGWFTRRTGQESNKTADWSAFVKEQREWTEDRLAERDTRISALETENAENRKRIAEQGEEIARLGRIEIKFKEAVSYIRRLVNQLKAHVPAEDIERPPSGIELDL